MPHNTHCLYNTFKSRRNAVSVPNLRHVSAKMTSQTESIQLPHPLYQTLIWHLNSKLCHLIYFYTFLEVILLV